MWRITSSSAATAASRCSSAPPLLEREPNWRAVLGRGLGEDEHETLRAGERTGRPLGSAAFVAMLEQALDRPITRRKPGRKPKAAEQVI